MLIIDEKYFFKQIMLIPFNSNINYYIQLFNKYNFDEILDDLIEDFREMYLPYLDKCKGFIEYKDNQFHIVKKFLKF